MCYSVTCWVFYLVLEIDFISAYIALAPSGFLAIMKCSRAHVQGFSRVDTSENTGHRGYTLSILIDAAKLSPTVALPICTVANSG